MTKTIFCDIDGTLLEHKHDIFKNILEPPVVLNNVVESFKKWDKLNYKIILTTGRKESYRKQTEEQLKNIGIPYDQMVMGIPNGDRILINDKKPNGIKHTAYAINLVRNKGLKNVDICNNVILSGNIENKWGSEDIIEHNQNYLIKKTFVKANHEIDFQLHDVINKTIYILEGKITILLGISQEDLVNYEYTTGEYVTILPYQLYKIYAQEDTSYIEVSTNESWDNVNT